MNLAPTHERISYDEMGGEVWSLYFYVRWPARLDERDVKLQA